MKSGHLLFYVVPMLGSILLGCAPNMQTLPQTYWPQEPSTHADQAASSVALGRVSPSSLRPAFAQAIKASDFYTQVWDSLPSDTLHPDVIMHVDVQTHYEQHYPWVPYLGCAILGPLWPYMPRQGHMRLTLNLQIESQGHALHAIKFIEEDDFQMSIYGPYRTSAIQNQIYMMHKRLQDRVIHFLRSLRQNATSTRYCQFTSP